MDIENPVSTYGMKGKVKVFEWILGENKNNKKEAKKLNENK